MFEFDISASKPSTRRVHVHLFLMKLIFFFIYLPQMSNGTLEFNNSHLIYYILHPIKIEYCPFLGTCIENNRIK